MLTPGAVRTSVTVGTPRVSVPVLSKTTVSTTLSASRCAPSLTKAPTRAMRAMAARTASGVPAAMPQAPATMITEIVADRSRVTRKVTIAPAIDR
ncbi:hypothetical protein MAJHIDBO_00687 [Propionibacterium freudenreichii subsp. shermanii]|nr:hypothetical protein MAJHIDBO_00687 [Propionibacterium freudenreichii subsp. shermanii]SPS08501.1 hypothetical protein MAJHIDBO_00687 [Propionibacterium freudenreichii subsp. shermanii]